MSIKKLSFGDLDLIFDEDKNIDIKSKYPLDNFPITLDSNNKKLSVFGYNTWDFTFFDLSTNAPRFIYFDTWTKKVSPLSKEITKQIKLIVFLRMFYDEDYPIKSVSGVNAFLPTLRWLAKFSQRNGVTIFDVLNNENLIGSLVRSLKKNGRHATHISVLLRKLAKVDESLFPFQLLPKKYYEPIAYYAAQYEKRVTKQTPPIPSRIYLESINLFRDLIDEFDLIFDDYMSVVNICATNIAHGRNRRKSIKLFKRHNAESWNEEIVLPKPGNKDECNNIVPDFDEMLKGPIANYCQKYHINDLVDLSSHLRKIQYICKTLMHAFSGMRDSEVLGCKYDCVRYKRIIGVNSPLIISRTSKFNDGIPVDEEWVTDETAVNAIVVLKKIAKSIYSIYQGSINESELNALPLFVKLSHLPFSSSIKSINNYTNPYRVASTFATPPLDNINLDILRIKEIDLNELRNINPFRAWDAEKEFAIGNVFKLNSHRFRRSLALYGQKTGLLSLPSLKFELKHLTLAMSEYYGNGNANAAMLININKKHFARDYQNTQSESQAISYIMNVIFSDEILFGGHGAWVKQRETVLSKSGRDKTMKAFKAGKISYNENMFGGCTVLGPCNKKAMRSTVACLDCKDSVIKLSKLEKVINAQDKLVASLDKQGQNYIYEKKDLDILNSKREFILKKNEEKIKGETV